MRYAALLSSCKLNVLRVGTRGEKMRDQMPKVTLTLTSITNYLGNETLKNSYGYQPYQNLGVFPFPLSRDGTNRYQLPTSPNPNLLLAIRRYVRIRHFIILPMTISHLESAAARARRTRRKKVDVNGLKQARASTLPARRPLRLQMLLLKVYSRVPQRLIIKS